MFQTTTSYSNNSTKKLVSFSINRTIIMTITIIVEEKIYIAIIKIILTIVLVIIVLL